MLVESIQAGKQLPNWTKRAVDSMSSVINTVPGMVLGIAFLFAFSGSSLQNTFWILIIANIVHYFATPYQMIKDSLTKMNGSWETTAKLMGDNWFKTIVRVVTPNAWPTIRWPSCPPCCWAERAHRPGICRRGTVLKAYDLSLSLRLQAPARENRLGCVLSSPRDNTHPK